MSNMVTRCPQCQTTFRVTEDHLKIANGAVRCGSCLHVFQARQHWVTPDKAAAPVATPKPSPVPAAKPEPATSPFVAPAPPADPAAKPAGKFQFDQSAIDSSSAAGLLQEPDSRIPETALTRAHQGGVQKKVEDIGDDERISDDTFIEDDEPDTVVATPAGTTGELVYDDDDYSDLFDEAGGEEGGDSDNFDTLMSGDFNDIEELVDFNAPDESGTGVSDESWAKEMLEELQHEDEPEAVDFSQVENIRDVLVDFTNPVDVDAARRDLGIDKDTGPFASRELTGSKPLPVTARAEMIAHIEPAPVELRVTRVEQVDIKPLLVWGSAAAFLVLLALGQFVFFNFEKLARGEESRPYIESLCGLVRCKVPSAESWRRIRISNLVVRKHPRVPNALTVDAILLNTGQSELRFPKLELYFNNMEQLPVASRRFEPAEYLAGEMTGQIYIPPGRPVHIAFEIVNPGDEAVNWMLQAAREPD